MQVVFAYCKTLTAVMGESETKDWFVRTADPSKDYLPKVRRTSGGMNVVSTEYSRHFCYMDVGI
jgi:hypothetical protein